MGADDKFSNAAQEAAGKVKEGLGKVTDNARLEAEGKADQVEAEFIKVSNVRSRDYFASTDARFIARQNEVGGIGGLQKVMGGAVVTAG